MTSRFHVQSVAYFLILTIGVVAFAVHSVDAEPESLLCSTIDRSIGRYESQAPFEAVELYGDYAYVSENDQAIQIFDLTDPAIPVIVHSIPSSEDQIVVFIDEARLYAREYGVGISVYDLTDPLNPILIEFHPIGEGLLAAINEQRAYLIDDNTRTLSVHDLRDGQAGALLGSLFIEVRAGSMAIQGNLAYIMCRGVMVVDISDPVAMQILNYDTVYRALDFVAISGHYLYCDYQGFSVLDISDPLAIEQVGSPVAPVVDRNTIVVGDRLLGLNDDAGLVEYDIEARSRPRITGIYPEESRFMDYSESQDIICCASDVGLFIYDATIAESPFHDVANDLERAFDSSQVGDEYWVASDEGIAVYAIDGSHKLQLLRISDRYPNLQSIVVEDDLAYIFQAGTGLRVLDVTDRENPVLVGQYAPLEPISFLAKDGDRLFVNMTYDKEIVEVLDISDPTHPRRMSTVNTWSDVRHAVIHADYLYLSTLYNELEIYDLSNPYIPQLVQRRQDQEYYNIIVAEDHLYTRVGAGLVVYAIGDAGQIDEVVRPDLGNRIVMTEFELQGDLLLYAGVDERDRLHGIGAVDLSAGPKDLVLLGESAVVEGFLDIDAYGDQMLGMSSSGSVSLIDIAGACGNCPADLNSDGLLNFFDVSTFLTAYIDGSPSADWNSDTLFNFFDVSGFLVSFKGGCPEL